jgi:hypothetical protein
MGKKAGKDSKAREVNLGSEYTEEEQRFLFELNRYKQTSGKSFITEKDAFRVAIRMGYRKQEPPTSDEGPMSGASLLG